MADKETTKTSKFLPLISRQEPERVELKLGEAGWVNVQELLKSVNNHGVVLSLEQLKHVVATSDKRRFAFSEDGQRIRANQGPVDVDLQYTPQLHRRFCITAPRRVFCRESGRRDCNACYATTSIFPRSPRSRLEPALAMASPRSSSFAPAILERV